MAARLPLEEQVIAIRFLITVRLSQSSAGITRPTVSPPQLSGSYAVNAVTAPSLPFVVDPRSLSTPVRMRQR
jgi:hypothetical protein